MVMYLGIELLPNATTTRSFLNSNDHISKLSTTLMPSLASCAATTSSTVTVLTPTTVAPAEKSDLASPRISYVGPGPLTHAYGYCPRPWPGQSAADRDRARSGM
jgi:hypothetical protein